METIYHPSKCGCAEKIHGIPMCVIQTVPCALLSGKRCYVQECDNAVEALGKLLNKEEGEEET